MCFVVTVFNKVLTNVDSGLINHSWSPFNIDESPSPELLSHVTSRPHLLALLPSTPDISATPRRIRSSEPLLESPRHVLYRRGIGLTEKSKDHVGMALD